MSSPTIQGLIAATITRFHSCGGVDDDAIGPLLDRLIDVGIAGFCVCGNAGEGTSWKCRLTEIGIFDWCDIEIRGER